MNFGQLIAKVIERLAEQADPQFWTKNEIKDYLNRGQKEFVLRTWWNLQEEDLVAGVGTGFYALPTGLLVPRAVFYAGEKLVQTTPEAADYITGWRTQTGTPTDWMILNAQVRVIPYPSSGTISMRHNKIPTQMVLDADLPDLPLGYHDVCWMWAAQECFTREGKGQNLEKATIYVNMFSAEVEMFKQAFAPPINHIPVPFQI